MQDIFILLQVTSGTNNEWLLCVSHSHSPFHGCAVSPFQIITRCDVCLLQEVRDSRGKALPLLLDSLKRWLFIRFHPHIPTHTHTHRYPQIPPQTPTHRPTHTHPQTHSHPHTPTDTCYCISLEVSGLDSKCSNLATDTCSDCIPVPSVLFHPQVWHQV